MGFPLLPPSVREGDHEVVEGAGVNVSLDLLHCTALSLSHGKPCQLPLGGSLSHKHILRLSFICFLFIGLAFFEPRHYGGVFIVQ